MKLNKILLIHGPNLNLLGSREISIYGKDSQEQLFDFIKSNFFKIEFIFFQSNHEGEIVTWIQEAVTSDALVINAGAYTHTSIAIQDALKSYPGLVVEIHISNPLQREQFRRHSFITATADAVAIGLGTKGYDLVIELICSEANAG